MQLLVKDPRKRLGGGPDDAESVRRHAFFKTIHWDDLLRKNIPAPFVPKIASATDVSNFRFAQPCREAPETEAITSAIVIFGPAPPFCGYSRLGTIKKYTKTSVANIL